MSSLDMHMQTDNVHGAWALLSSDSTDELHAWMWPIAAP